MRGLRVGLFVLELSFVFWVCMGPLTIMYAGSACECPQMMLTHALLGHLLEQTYLDCHLFRKCILKTTKCIPSSFVTLNFYTVAATVSQHTCGEEACMYATCVGEYHHSTWILESLTVLAWWCMTPREARCAMTGSVLSGFFVQFGSFRKCFLGDLARHWCSHDSRSSWNQKTVYPRQQHAMDIHLTVWGFLVLEALYVKRPHDSWSHVWNILLGSATHSLLSHSSAKTVVHGE